MIDNIGIKIKPRGSAAEYIRIYYPETEILGPEAFRGTMEMDKFNAILPWGSILYLRLFWGPTFVAIRKDRGEILVKANGEIMHENNAQVFEVDVPGTLILHDVEYEVTVFKFQ